jgi:hypothetical protein
MDKRTGVILKAQRVTRAVHLWPFYLIMQFALIAIAFRVTQAWETDNMQC